MSDRRNKRGGARPPSAGCHGNHGNQHKQSSSASSNQPAASGPKHASSEQPSQVAHEVSKLTITPRDETPSRASQDSLTAIAPSPMPASTSSSTFEFKRPISRPKSSDGKFLYCTLGKEIKTIRTNHFEMQLDKSNSMLIYRYDVEVLPSKTNKMKKRKVMDLAWRNAEQYFGLPSCPRGQYGYGYDGNKQLYTSMQLDIPKKFELEHDENGRASRFSIELKKQTGTLNLADLLNAEVADVTEILSGLEIILLTRAAFTYETSLRRSFFYPLPNPQQIRGAFKEIWAGFYVSARPTSWTVTVNLDVTASVVIQPRHFLELFDDRACRQDVRRMNWMLQDLKRDLKIYIDIPGKLHQKRNFLQVVASKTARTYRFKNDQGVMVTMEQHFRETYQTNIRHLDHPLVQIKSGRDVFYPMEFCSIAPGQLSPSKRESDEQGQLVRFMSQLSPADRYRNIVNDFRQKFASREQIDLLSDFGIQLSPEPVKIPEARILPPVTIQAGQTVRNKTGFLPVQQDGRDPGKFILQNAFYEAPKNVPNWAIIDASGQLSQNDVEEWKVLFLKALERKNIRLSDKPLISREETSDLVAKRFDQLVAGKVTFIVFLIDRKQQPLIYGHIKQLGDRRHHVATQCADIGKWQRMNDAYMDNLVLKVHNKLGGINWIVASDTFKSQHITPLFDKPVLLVGADVTHPGRDDKSKPSIAAVVGSIDQFATKYVAVITPQSRTAKADQNCTQEWISDLCATMKKLLRAYYKNAGQIPGRIIFYRDGVSEGQYASVLYHELGQIQQACLEMPGDYRPAITYIVVRKRIKTKLFDVRTDNKENIVSVNNVMPGTLVEVKITQPLRYFDWFLVPHNSPLGTAKPTHYVVLYDDSKFTPNDICYLSFALCHVFPRCTKAVSLPAPVYHAHLAAERANYHLAGKPFDAQGIDDVDVLRHKQLEHTREVTSMSYETSIPNYWI